MTNWTIEQSAFIDAARNSEDSLRLDAVAGSGKTTTLLQAAKGLPAHQSIIALAFNKKIADDLSKKFPSRIVCKTLNGVGHQVWLKAQGKRNLDTRKMGDLTSKWCDKNLTKEESEILWNQIRVVVTAVKSMGFVPQEWEHKLYKPAPVITEEVIESICDSQDIGYVKLHYLAAKEIMLSSISEAFTTRIDFDDQIYMSTYFAPDECWPVFDVVMVDEAQDLSRVQHDMIERLGGNSRLIVVGDERQAIYGWRGASTNSLNELTERFGLIKMPLTVCFRCPEKVIKEAQRLVPHIKAAKPGGTVHIWETSRERDEDGKALESGPAWFVDDFVRGSVVLCRNNAPLIKLGFAFIRYGIPCYFTGKDLSAGLKKIVEGLSDSIPPLDALQDWYDSEYARLMEKKKYDQIDRLGDKFDALHAIYTGSDATSKITWIRGIDKLFMREPSPEAIELSTIHKSKGKEWEVVYFLNEHLLPGKWIAEAAAKGVPGADDLLLQEDNLKYVAITRALDTLVYFTLGKDEKVFSKADWQSEVLHDES